MDYYDYYYDTYYNTPFSMALIKKGMKGIDIGCGKGDAKKILNEKGINVTGVDISPESKCDILADARNLPFGDNNFDYIVCISTLMEIREDEKVIIEMKRTLKPGGKLILELGNMWSWTLLTLRHNNPKEFPNYYKMYSTRSIKEILEDFNFKVDHVYSAGFIPRSFSKLKLGNKNTIVKTFFPLEGLLQNIPGIKKTGTRIIVIASNGDK